MDLAAQARSPQLRRCNCWHTGITQIEVRQLNPGGDPMRHCQQARDAREVRVVSGRAFSRHKIVLLFLLLTIGESS
jgi:hypothetical protein